MRIIGDIEHPNMKITIFFNNNRVSIKFENELFEQTYKFREGMRVDNFEEAKQLVTPVMQQAVMEQFITMNKIRTQALTALQADSLENEFEEII